MDMLNKEFLGIPVIVLVVIAAVAYVVVKRGIGEPLNARDLVGPPLILSGIGVYQLTKVGGLVWVDHLWLVGGILVGLACGAVRGTTIRIFIRRGVLWQRYSGLTFVTWLVSLVVSGGFGLLAAAAGMNAQARPILLSIGVGMLGEMLTLGLRAVSTGRPFSPDRKDSAAAHRDLLADLADRIRPPATGSEPDGRDVSPSLRQSISRLSRTLSSPQRRE